MKKNNSNRYRKYLFVWENCENKPDNFWRESGYFKNENRALDWAESQTPKPNWFKKYHKHPKKLNNRLGQYDYVLKD